MTEADEARSLLDSAIAGLGTITAILYSLEHEINVVKANVQIAGLTSTRMEPQFAGDALARSLLETGSMITRMLRIKTGLEEWQSTL
jgi:hypothetical protein